VADTAHPQQAGIVGVFSRDAVQGALLSGIGATSSMFKRYFPAGLLIED